MSSFPDPYRGPSGSAQDQRQSRTRWFLLGAGFIVFALLVLWSCGKGAYRDHRLAVGAIERFHQQLNRGEYEEIYGEASEEYRRAGSRGDEIKLFETVHDKMGDAGKTSIKGFHINATTRGIFVNELYETQFSLGPAQEVFVWRIDQDGTRLITYHIDSPNFC